MSSPSPITSQEVANAIIHVDRLTFDENISYCEQIAEQQPAVLRAVVQLHSLDVDPVTQEHAFYVLMVLNRYFTQKDAGFPRICEDAVQQAMDNNLAMVDFLDNELPDEASRLHQLSVEKYPEREVLAFTVSYLHEQGLTRNGRDNQLVVHVCKSITDAFANTRRLTRQETR